MPWLEGLKFLRGYQMGTHKIIYEIMDDKVYILRVIHHSQNITNNFFLAENEIPYVVESD